jgi:hypothetical protein
VLRHEQIIAGLAQHVLDSPWRYFQDNSLSSQSGIVGSIKGSISRLVWVCCRCTDSLQALAAALLSEHANAVGERSPKVMPGTQLAVKRDVS